MSRAVTAVVGLLFLSNAVSAAQPQAARGVAPLPASAAAFARTIRVSDPDTSTLMLSAIRIIHGGDAVQARQARERLAGVLREAGDGTREVVPLPLNAGIWEEVLLQTPAGSAGLVPAILNDRRAALLYFGLAALDDETLGWLRGQRETLLHLRKNPGVFAAFGRSLRIRGGRIAVPGGREVEPLWTSVVGADPANPAAFVQRIISGEGRLAFLYDTIDHLDGPRQRFALGLGTRSSSREDGLRSLLASFTAAAPDWRVDERPFTRPPIDGAMLLSTVRVTERGTMAPPTARGLWERIFRADALTDVRFERVDQAAIDEMSGYLSVDAPLLASRILRVPYALGRRRLDTLLFAQRVFGDRPGVEAAAVATALRGYMAFPALMISLERSGIRNPIVFSQAAEHAARQNGIDSLPLRASAIAEFQSAIALIERTHLSRVLDEPRAEALVASLASLELSSRAAYESRFSTWLRDQFLPRLPARSSAEETILNAIAGQVTPAEAPIIEWEGERYRVDPAWAELKRLRQVRERQGGPTLDDVLSGARGTEQDGARALADTLMSIVYAVHLGDPEGAAVTSGNVALRHDFGIAEKSPDNSHAEPWRLPIELFDGKAAWRVRGSLLGLEAPLARLALRRVDPTAMPGEPTLGPQDRQTVMLTAALVNPFEMSDAVRDTIVGAIARGRARVDALLKNPSDLDDVASAAGLSEWRHQALRWLFGRGEEILSRFSLLELLWAGLDRQSGTSRLDAWGAAQLPLTGCFCLEMPPPVPWEDLGGRPAAVIGTHGADVLLHIAETLAVLKLPAALAAGLAGYVTQDVMEHAELAYPDDWQQFDRAARELPRERMFDYIAALTAGGALVPVEK